MIHDCARWVALASVVALAANAGEVKEIYDTEDPSQQVMSPVESLRSMRLPEGYQATMFAAEPDVRQPIAMTFDERGRLWVVECYTYAEGARDFDTELRDRVLIFEDTNDDGVHDLRTIFWDQGRKLTSIELGLGGVWLLGAPNLLFLPDHDRDDKPDGPPEVVLEGWKETGIRHNIVNGLKWGPDGWLYGRQGILETSHVGPPGASESQRVHVNCGVWRYHPRRQQFEVVLDGTTNPWGFDYDAVGEIFIINTVIGHLWHVVGGARTERMYGTDPHPYSYELMNQVADHVHWDSTSEQWHEIRKKVSDKTKAAGGGHAHSGLLIYQGSNWPAQEHGKALAINFHGRRINRDRFERHGSGMVARHEADLLFWDDPWFRGLELISGPDGGVYVLDWSDTGECHEENGIHRSSGRIYKITFREPPRVEPFDLQRRSSAELVQLQTHSDDWWTRAARRVLRDRAAQGTDMTDAVNAARAMLGNSGESLHRLRALWLLEQIDAVGETDLLTLLRDKDESLRVWSVRLLGDRLKGESPSSHVAQALFDRANEDSSQRVRLYLASTLQRLPIRDRWSLAAALTKGLETDKATELLVWYGIEPALLTDPQKAIEFFAKCQRSRVRTFVARRLATEMEIHPAWIDAILAGASGDALRDAVIGLSQALRGWANAASLPAWERVRERIGSTGDNALRQAMLEIGIVFGEGRTLEELKALVESGPLDIRIRAIRTLATSNVPKAAACVVRYLDDRDLHLEVIRAMASFDVSGSDALLLGRIDRWSDEARAAAIGTLAARPHTARSLLMAVRENKIDRGEITAFHARQILSFNDPDLTALLKDVWGEVHDSPEEQKTLIQSLKQSLTSDRLAAADFVKGRSLFQRHCATCHILHGAGRKLGPDLTGANRKNIDYLLENIVAPSAIVAADFRASTILMNDGRALTGFIAESNDRTFVVQTQENDLPIDRREVEEIHTTTKSIMPDGLLQNLSPDDVRDLVAYLMSDEQVSVTR